MDRVRRQEKIMQRMERKIVEADHEHDHRADWKIEEY